ncbi:unnamed protein product, partial [marine sediment metagenome]
STFQKISKNIRLPLRTTPFAAARVRAIYR